MGARLRLADLLGGLSIVADLGFGLPPETAMRSCLIGTGLARRLAATEEEIADIFYATLLLHVGCVALAHETAVVLGDDRRVNRAVAHTNLGDPFDVFRTLIPEGTRGLPPLARARAAMFIVGRGRRFGRSFETGSCEVARETARRVGLRPSVQRALYEVYEAWNGTGAPRGLRGDAIAPAARVARLASEAALLSEVVDWGVVVDRLRRRSGGILDPSFVEVLVADGAELVAEAAHGDPRERILSAEPRPIVEIDPDSLPRVAAAFGDLADLKTPFTHGHSRAVARLAVAAAGLVRLDPATGAGLELAALLHDLGRVAVSNAIWEKPGALSAAEWEQVRVHPYWTERILAGTGALAPVAALAGTFA